MNIEKIGIWVSIFWKAIGVSNESVQIAVWRLLTNDLLVSPVTSFVDDSVSIEQVIYWLCICITSFDPLVSKTPFGNL